MFKLRKDQQLAAMAGELEKAKREINSLRIQLQLCNDDIASKQREIEMKDQQLRKANDYAGGVSYSRVQFVKAAKPQKRHMYVMALQKQLRPFVQETASEIYMEVLRPEKEEF